MSSSFEHMAVVTASTKRTPAVVGGKRGQPVTNVASLACTPLDPIDSETRARLGLDSPAIILETYVDLGVDIVYGDILVVGAQEYPVKIVEDWYWPPDATSYRRLFVEKVAP
jgi:hypothetical protein